MDDDPGASPFEFDPSSEPIVKDVDDSAEEMMKRLAEAEAEATGVISGPGDLFGDEGDPDDPGQLASFTFEATTGRFWPDGRRKVVEVTATPPERPLEVAAAFLAYSGRPRANIFLWAQFNVTPKWLLEQERHGVFLDDDGNMLIRGTKEYNEHFDEATRRLHKKKQLPDILVENITTNLQLGVGVDGDFIERRLKLMSTERRQAAARLTLSSLQGSRDRSQKSVNGQNVTVPNSSST